MCKILNPRVLKIITSVWMCRMLWTCLFKILIWGMPDLLWMCQMVKTSIFKIFMLNTPRVNCYPLAFITFSRQLFQSASIDRSVVCLSQTTSVWLALLAYFKYEPLETILLNQSNNCINIWKQKYFVSSVRSSNSHPDLLVITTTTTTPLFQITPVLNTGLSLSEPLQLYIDYNAI